MTKHKKNASIIAMVNRNYPQAILHANGVRANQGETGSLTDIEIRRAGAIRIAKILGGAMLVGAMVYGGEQAFSYAISHSPTVEYQQDLQRQQQNQPSNWLEQQLQQQQVEQQQANNS